MTLRIKTLVIIGLTLISLIIILYISSRINLMGSFSKLEEQIAHDNVKRVSDTLAADLSTMNDTAADWAAWDDTYAFIENDNNDYIKSNLVDQTFTELKLNLILYIDLHGQIVFGKGFDLNNNKEIPVPATLEHLSLEDPILKHADTKSSLTGIVILPEGPMLIVSRPIVTSDFKGPIHGTMIMGRYLDSTVMKRLSDRTHLSVTLYRLSDSKAPPEIQIARSFLSDEEPIYIRPLSADLIAGYTLLKDIYGRPGLVLSVDMPREIYKQGQNSMRYFMLSLLLIGLVFALVTLLLLEKVILSRLAGLSASVNSVGESGDFSSRVSMTGGDELASLAGNVNGMLAALEQSHYDLQESKECYSSLVELSPYTIYVHSDCKFVFMNSAGAKLLGAANPQELIGRPIFDVIHPDYRDIVTHRVQQLMEKGKEATLLEEKFIRLDGAVVDVEVTAVPITYEGKQAVLVIAHDIAGRKEAEKKIHQTVSELQVVFQALPDLYFRLDADGTILDVKAGCVSDLYLPPGEITGKKIQELFPLTIRHKAQQAILQVLKTKSLVVMEYSLTPKEGEQFFEARYLPLLENQIIVIVRNITERKCADEQLKHLSLHDALTDLYNRAYFEQEMRRLEGGRSYPVGTIICDVDGLKLINDTLGHDSGDKLLAAAASVIRESFREGDTVARIGGDEFAVLLPDTDRTDVKNACNRIQEAVEKYNAVNPEIPLNISVGFAVCSDASKKLVDIFKEADNSMYREKLHRSQSARSTIVQTLMKMLEARDFITEGHADRLQNIVADLAIAIGLSEHKVNDLRLLAQFHDIGKVGIPDRILLKPGPLTTDEVTEMRQHCEIGYRIAQSAPDLVPIADWILKHHEWWNGKGYPWGLKGEEIPLECRILAIADAYDAMTCDRPYRKAMSHHDAVAELLEYAGTQFDAQLVEKFILTFEQRNILDEI